MPSCGGELLGEGAFVTYTIDLGTGGTLRAKVHFSILSKYRRVGSSEMIKDWLSESALSTHAW